MGYWLRRMMVAAVVAAVAVALLPPPHGHDRALAANGTWTGQYWNNITLNGSPALTRDDGPTLDFFWDGSPGSGVNSSNFSARWERTDTYAAGSYRFTITGDDGIRIYVDNVLILNAWVDQGPTTYFTDYTLTAGSHTVKVEFYDSGGGATAIASIQTVASIPPGWQGEYFNNTTLGGAPVRTRNDGEDLNFQWNSTAPGSPFPGVINNNSFSVRWTRTLSFSDEVWEFTTVTDDGVRLYVDGFLLIDFWVTQSSVPHSAVIDLAPGNHIIVMEYFEASGGANASLTFQERPDLGGFVHEVIENNLDVVTAFAFAPDGRIFLAEKDGGVRIIKNGSLLGTPYYTVANVNNDHDRGLLGITLDPNFASNGYVYLAYTYENNAADPTGLKTAQVIRVNANTPLGDVANGATKLVLLGSVVGTPADPSCEEWPLTADCIPSDYDSHTIGNLKFGPDGMLYVATGDGASYATVDVRALRAQSIDRLAGKFLRVNPANGEGLPDNPFWNGSATATRSKVWAYGVRNDFRFNFKTGGVAMIFSGDVGWNLWEEINVVTAGDNLGWPCHEGPFLQGGYQAYSTCQNLSFGSVQQALHFYDHPPDSAAVGGAFTGVNSYPAAYQNTFFWGDYARDEISVLKVDGSNNLVAGSVNVFSSVADGPVDIEIGPEGDVYYLAINAAELRRIHYIGGNRPPVAVANGAPLSGVAPLNVSFSSAGSNDPDPGDSITFEWDFGDGTPDSMSANPSHQYASNGTYTATLTVRDELLALDTDTVQVTVGNQAPTAIINTPADGSHFDIGNTINYTGTGTDPEDTTIPAGSRTWQVNLWHCNEIALINCHPHNGTPTTGAGGSFVATDHGDFTYYEIVLTVEDSGGLEDTTSIDITPNRVDLSFTSNRSGVQITLDGLAQTVPFTNSVPKGSQHTVFAASPQNPGGGNIYFSAWSDGGAQQHTVTANSSMTLTATFVDPTPTPTPTNTPTPTFTPTPTPTKTDTPTPTSTPTPSNTPTGTPVPDTDTPTPTPTDTGTPTDTPTPTATATPCTDDADCDGVTDAADNCIDVSNPGQQNSNGEIQLLPPPALYNDETNPVASPLGDACHPDIDNDGLNASGEAAAGTSATDGDSDDDRALDGAEVTCGSDPLLAASVPAGADADGDTLSDACEASVGSNPAVRDTDGDGFHDGMEFIRIGTDPLDANTDDDSCADGKELASINEDQDVNVIDLAQIAFRASPLLENPLYYWNFDPNRDKVINTLDLLQAATQFGAC